MNTTNNYTNKEYVELFESKRQYISPEILHVKLDNEISLALQSAPPIGPDEGFMQNSEQSNNCFYV